MANERKEMRKNITVIKLERKAKIAHYHVEIVEMSIENNFTKNKGSYRTQELN